MDWREQIAEAVDGHPDLPLIILMDDMGGHCGASRLLRYWRRRVQKLAAVHYGRCLSI